MVLPPLAELQIFKILETFAPAICTSPFRKGQHEKHLAGDPIYCIMGHTKGEEVSIYPRVI
jgi:hypothetical protein